MKTYTCIIIILYIIPMSTWFFLLSITRDNNERERLQHIIDSIFPRWLDWGSSTLMIATMPLLIWSLNGIFFGLCLLFNGFAPIFPDICYHLTHYKPAAADIPVASDNPAHYADAIRYNARTPLQGSLLPLTRLVWA